MDIFEWADENDWKADYYDYHTGYIYAIGKAPDHDTIPVYADGELIGYCRRNK